MRDYIPCPSPRGTNIERIYLHREPQLAMDQALNPDNPSAAPDDNGAQAGAASEAYANLFQYLESNNDTEGQAMLKHLMNCMTNGGAMDQPIPFSGRPTPAMDAELRLRAAARSGQAQAQQFLFNKKFPNAARIRIVG